MKRGLSLLFLLAVGVLLAPCALAEEQLAAPLDFKLVREEPSDSTESRSLPETGIVLLYFHQTYRCETCLGMERRIRQAMDELAAERPSVSLPPFIDLDYQASDNWDPVNRFGISAIELILAKRQDGEWIDWKKFDAIWAHEAEDAFKSYVKSEVLAYLDAAAMPPDESLKPGD
jgi:hypothetical protein